MKALKDYFWGRKLRSLPAIAARNGLLASDRVAAFLVEAHGDPARTAAVIDKGLEASPAIAGMNFWLVRHLFDKFATATRGDAALTAKFIDKGLEIAPDLAARSGYAAHDFLITLGAAAHGDPSRIAAVVDTSLAVMPTIVAQNAYAAGSLITALAEIAQNDPVQTAIVFDAGLKFAPSIAVKDDYAARNLITFFAQTAGLGDDPVVCREFVRMPRMGPYNRHMLVLFGGSPDTCQATTGVAIGHDMLVFGAPLESARTMGSYLNGSLPELRAAAKNFQPQGSFDRSTYDRVVTDAFGLLGKRKELSAFRDLVRTRGQRTPVAA